VLRGLAGNFGVKGKKRCMSKKHEQGLDTSSRASRAVRINKYLARVGHCSRRQADALVAAGAVTINGEVAAPGSQVEPGAQVCVSGVPVGSAPPPVVLMFHKPAGVVTTTDQRVPNNIMSYIDYPGRVFPVGRLDQSSSGLILLTNDGSISRRILDPAENHEKEYVVRVDRPFGDSLLKTLAQGVVLDGRPTRPCRVERLGARAFRMVLTEGRNRQIRRMCEACGYRVVRLRRVRIMNIELGDLAPGQWRRVDLSRLFPPEEVVSSRDCGSRDMATPGASPLPGASASTARRRKRSTPSLHPENAGKPPRG